MADLIDACLSEDPEQRPTARRLVEVLSDAAAAGPASLRRSSAQVHGLHFRYANVARQVQVQLRDQYNSLDVLDRRH